MENWKIIEATDNLYEISDKGNVRSKGILQPIKINNAGYSQVRIKLKFGSRHFLLHKIVAAYFIENNDPLKTEINHIDGNKQNNSVDNLEWCTSAENQYHKIHVLGKNQIGPNNPMYGRSGIKSPVFKGYIYKIDPITKDKIQKYEGSGDASRNMNCRASNIIKVLNKNKIYKGFMWIRE